MVKSAGFGVRSGRSNNGARAHVMGFMGTQLTMRHSRSTNQRLSSRQMEEAGDVHSRSIYLCQDMCRHALMGVYNLFQTYTNTCNSCLYVTWLGFGEVEECLRATKCKSGNYQRAVNRLSYGAFGFSCLPVGNQRDPNASSAHLTTFAKLPVGNCTNFHFIILVWQWHLPAPQYHRFPRTPADHQRQPQLKQTNTTN